MIDRDRSIRLLTSAVSVGHIALATPGACWRASTALLPIPSATVLNPGKGMKARSAVRADKRLCREIFFSFGGFTSCTIASMASNPAYTSASLNAVYQLRKKACTSIAQDDQHTPHHGANILRMMFLTTYLTCGSILLSIPFSNYQSVMQVSRAIEVQMYPGATKGFRKQVDHSVVSRQQFVVLSDVQYGCCH